MEGSFQLDSLLRHHSISSALSFPYELNSSSDSDSYSYSKPILLLEVIWNTAFVLVSWVVLLSSFSERPSTPLRLWAFVYALQCFVHVFLLCLDHFRRVKIHDHHYISPSDAAGEDDHRMASQSIMKRLESVNTTLSTVWWTIGFYWIVSGGQSLLQDSPRLYWLTVVFLAFDVFFIMFCIGTTLIAFLVVFGCLPILAIAYAVAVRKGASEDDIRRLPKYKYYQDYPSATTLANDKNQEGHFSTEPEESECCICLTRYANGVELCSLPCNHHFHSGCITKWLKMNATCPLCKFNIRSPDTLV